jgi:Ni/Fe-hydrogenase subunit HybB-like protein
MNENVWDGEWYIPSKNELKSLYAAFSGLTYADIEISWTDGNAMPDFDSQTYKDARTAFNLKMTTAGGSILNDTGRYWTSTEFDANKAWFIRFNTSVLEYNQEKYDTWTRVRPILAF